MILHPTLWNVITKAKHSARRSANLGRASTVSNSGQITNSVVVYICLVKYLVTYVCLVAQFTRLISTQTPDHFNIYNLLNWSLFTCHIYK